MSNLALLPKVGINHQNNLDGLIKHYQNVLPFDVSWSDARWKVTGKVKDKANRSHADLHLHFTRDNGLGSKVKEKLSDMKPFYSHALADIAKCHICYLHIQTPKTKGYLQTVINTYRLIDNVLYYRRVSIDKLSNRVFSEALQEALDKYAISTAYREGVRLKQISDFVDKKGLSTIKVKFRSHLKRGDIHTTSDTRIDFESQTNRHEKLPSKNVLVAIGKLSSSNVLTGVDKLYLSITEILFTTGLRIDEALSLATDSLYEKEEEIYNELLGKYELTTYWELKYFSKKNKGYATKVIADSFVPIVRRAFEYAMAFHEPIRNVLSEIEEKRFYDFYPALEETCFVSEESVYKLLGSSNSNALTRLKKWGVSIQQRHRVTNGQGKKPIASSFNAMQLKIITSNMATQCYDKVWSSLGKMTTASKLSEMLFVTQHQEHHAKKSTNRWDFRLVTDGQYSDFITGRDSVDDVPSIFERQGLTIEGEKFRITSHQFRHFLNTICHLSDSISELEVARYFGRSFELDNQAYDHSNKAKMIMDNATAVLSSNGVTKEQAIDIATQFTLVDSDEALEAVQDLTSTLITSIGLCKHDFNDSPCGKHYACLRGCSQYKRIKGDKSEIDEIMRIKLHQELSVEEARKCVAEEYSGTNNWLLSHEELLKGCEAALEIESNPGIADGEAVYVFPNGNDGCEAI